ncbi:MAG: DUF6448 family protein [Bacteroidales bacterium]|nr:DUF6448 family protein [Bacteroidales bacterium]MDD3522414.1 DUF6448 family protein [Bacteroidales bacterium]MDD4030813.1 DUF6448 family protein [Bacteroidales bacterium]MDD4436161.1 DUF6448 family protein [Bacteroidales bacterium]MDD5732769.1 DUF6448 family protein [Bacteroidales bacterium]
MKTTRKFRMLVLTVLFMLVTGITANAHCDSYDGPVIKDAMKALDGNNVAFVMKWIGPEHEAEITNLFNKTIFLQDKDPEVYGIVKKYFLETLVRYHRETEGAPYTGLKPAGTAAPIVNLADNALAQEDVNILLEKLNNHIGRVITEKYDKVAELSKVKELSVEQGRAYVDAYVDYTHTLEAIEAVIAHGGHH